ncbi:MAG: Hpt domain-containing protein [Flavobacteriales bacterium]|nr:Hpt domain-containing protein [Flavobacteriales bacterium]
MPQIHIDLSTLDRLFKGDRVQVVQWVQLYIEEAPGYFERVESCMTNGDASGLSAAAHELRPQAHYLGAPRMLELLIQIGEKAGTEGVAACAQAVEELLDLGRQVTAELQSEVLGP